MKIPHKVYADILLVERLCNISSIRLFMYKYFTFIQCNGKDISWSHLVKLYQVNRSETPGLALIPKLKYEYINLTSYSKMRVDLAAQVSDIYGSLCMKCML